MVQPGKQRILYGVYYIIHMGSHVPCPSQRTAEGDGQRPGHGRRPSHEAHNGGWSPAKPHTQHTYVRIYR